MSFLSHLQLTHLTRWKTYRQRCAFLFHPSPDPQPTVLHLPYVCSRLFGSYTVQHHMSIRLNNEQWIEEVRQICGDQIPVILVGCKQDLRPDNLPPSNGNARPDQQYFEKTYVDRARGERMARAIGARAYKECSALRLDGVDDVFEAATRASMLMRVPPNGSSSQARHSRKGSALSGDEQTGSRWSCCVVS